MGTVKWFLAWSFLLMQIEFSLQYSVNNVILTVQPYEEECFFERVTPDAILIINLIVTDGGFLDINFVEIYPNNTVSSEGRTKEKFAQYVATEEGIYTFCLNNEFSSISPKVIKLVYIFIEAGDREKLIKEHGARNVTTETLLNELSDSLKKFEAANSILAARKILHHQLNNHTNSMILWWSIFEATTMIALAIGQIYYVRKFFEVRRYV